MKKKIKKIVKHLKDDAKMFKKERLEDKKLIKSLKSVPKKVKKIASKAKNKKIADVMEEFKEGTLRSGSKRGPKVTSRKQALAIALSEARKKKAVKKKKK